MSGKTLLKNIFLIFCISILCTMVSDACPNCKDAFASGPEASIGESYSWSILFMLGMFMSVIGGFSFLIWSKVKKTNYNM